MNGIVAPPCNKVTVRSTRDSGSEHNRAISRIIRSSVSVIVPLLIQKRQRNKIFRKSRTRKLPVSLYPKRTDYGSPGSSRKTSDPCTGRLPTKRGPETTKRNDFQNPGQPVSPASVKIFDRALEQRIRYGAGRHIRQEAEPSSMRGFAPQNDRTNISYPAGARLIMSNRFGFPRKKLTFGNASPISAGLPPRTARTDKNQ